VAGWRAGERAAGDDDLSRLAPLFGQRAPQPRPMIAYVKHVGTDRSVRYRAERDGKLPGYVCRVFPD